VEPTKAEKKADRKIAPSLMANLPFHEQRLAQEEFFDEKDPGFKHMYQREETSAQELADKNLEVVQADGKPVRHGGDVLCRMKKVNWDARKGAESQMSMSAVKRIVKDERTLTKTANPVQPKIKE
jgi:hypothetical protein